jgi:hypothetical protein
MRIISYLNFVNMIVNNFYIYTNYNSSFLCKRFTFIFFNQFLILLLTYVLSFYWFLLMTHFYFHFEFCYKTYFSNLLLLWILVHLISRALFILLICNLSNFSLWVFNILFSSFFSNYLIFLFFLLFLLFYIYIFIFLIFLIFFFFNYLLHFIYFLSAYFPFLYWLFLGIWIVIIL